ncbi:replication protein A 70 kDa DNA-binding subunit E-like isoform X2 [Hibiscus syriacus]|uniref:replication protein A 70 kDa DNA-binding subunit E-like isoform X2 n=1 Tax=Hibiscus syriacus TaxID=106335 RepID=UPI00192105C1|nr:replication protein A 70 kDa DNA-binding subunit E-like isoform X2 [Hibiscus syriacus]
MEVNLTGEAVTRIINGEVSASSDLKPVLQVIELEEIQTTSQQQQQQQEPRNSERGFVLLLSDGVLTQQCLLAASKKRLVKSSKLQIGSIVRLTQFVSNFVQDRMVVIIIELEVMVGQCDIIGKPVPAQKSTSFAQAHTGFHSPGPVVSHPLIQSVPVYQQPSPFYINREPPAKNEIGRIIPISVLNPYQGSWTIKARVTKKQELKHYRNAHGEGKVFSFNLIDLDGGEIRATCFNAVVDQFYNQIQAGNIYLISRGSLKPAQKEFNHLNSDYQIFLDSRSIVQLCSEDNTIPWQKFHFRAISDVEDMKNNDVVDIIGVVFSVGPTALLMRKNDSEILKRSLHLKDMSGRSVELTLWGAFCNSEGEKLQTLCDSGEFPILAVKSGRVSDFSGKEVGTISSTQLFINPDFPEARKLREWFAGEGRNTSSVSIAREKSSLTRTFNRKTISQIKDERLGTSEKPDWITVVATVVYIKLDDFCYTACPLMDGDLQCNKKVTDNGDGKWRCNKCDRNLVRV